MDKATIQHLLDNIRILFEYYFGYFMEIFLMKIS